MSMSNMRIKRKISKHMKYNLDEFRTLILNNVTENKCKNMYMPNKKGQSNYKRTKDYNSFIDSKVCEYKGVKCVQTYESECNNWP